MLTSKPMSANGGTITWREVQRRFNRAGRRCTKKQAQLVSSKLSIGVQVTGWSQDRFIDALIGNPDLWKLLRAL